MAYLSQRLVTIVTDIQWEKGIEDFRLGRVDEVELRSLFSELEFHSFEKKLFDSPPVTKNPKQNNSQRKLSAWIETTWNLSDLEKKIDPYSEIWIVVNERGVCLGYQKQAIWLDGAMEQVGAVLGPKYLSWKGYV